MGAAPSPIPGRVLPRGSQAPARPQEAPVCSPANPLAMVLVERVSPGRVRLPEGSL